MKAKLLGLTGLCTVALALALPASSVATTPPIVQPVHYTVGPFDAGPVCGVPDVIEVYGADGVMKIDADGAVHSSGKVLWSTLTNPANGKVVTFKLTGSTTSSALVDNGDGTYTVKLRFAAETTYAVPQSGEHWITSGEFDAVLTLDSSLNVIAVGQTHSSADGSGPVVTTDSCPFINSALT